MRWLLKTALCVSLASGSGCAEPVPADPAEQTEEEEPAVEVEPAVETTPTAEESPSAPDTRNRSPLEPVDVGRPIHLDERTGARVRSAIRRRVGARPTLLTSRHYRTEDRGSVTFAAFTAPYLERCVASGTPREECLLGGGDGALTRNQQDCVFGGIARIDLGPDEGERPGPMRIVGVHALEDGQACAFEVDSLRLVDEDRDGEPEVRLRYTWSDLRHAGAEHVVTRIETVRETRRSDLGVQVQLTLRAFHPGSDDPEERNLVSQLRHVGDGDHPDLAHDVIDWLAAACPEEDPPRGHEECELRERTLRYTYDAPNDAWVPDTTPRL
ncbi:MAG: hypothetical protein AB8I08_08350 [Sandaracinaceae bacterium]